MKFGHFCDFSPYFREFICAQRIRKVPLDLFNRSRQYLRIVIEFFGPFANKKKLSESVECLWSL